MTSEPPLCPSCGKSDLHHSRTRSGTERIRRWLTAKVPFRCGACGWRGWRPDDRAADDSGVRRIRRASDSELDGLDPTGQREN